MLVRKQSRRAFTTYIRFQNSDEAPKRRIITSDKNELINQTNGNQSMINWIFTIKMNVWFLLQTLFFSRWKAYICFRNKKIMQCFFPLDTIFCFQKEFFVATLSITPATVSRCRFHSKYSHVWFNWCSKLIWLTTNQCYVINLGALQY